MITDKEMEEFANEFKEFREWKKKVQKPRTWVSDSTCPNALDLKYSQFMYPTPPIVINREFIDNQPYNKLQKIIDNMESISKALIDGGVMNLGLSLRTNIEDLKKLIAGVKE